MTDIKSNNTTHTFNINIHEYFLIYYWLDNLRAYQDFGSVKPFIS